MSLLPLILIPLLFLLFAIAKPWIQRTLRIPVCALCAAVSATWLVLLLRWLVVGDVDPTVLALLMGMSVTGVMSKIGKYYDAQNLRYGWLAKLLTIVGGYALIVLLLAKSWPLFTLVTLATILTMIILTFLCQGVTHESVVEETKPGVAKSLLKKLDNCC